jgi:hypothetical protein
MKKIILLTPMLSAAYWVAACEVCERNQPKVLRGISHGAGPESKWDYVIVWITIAIVVLTLFYSIKWLIKPGEKSDRHIKRFILNNQ